MLELANDTRSVVLVEGVSDRAALEALARRHGRDLRAEGVSIVPIGGAHRIARVLEELGQAWSGVACAGLCDAQEAGVYARALERAGLGANLTRAAMEQVGFYACEADLEDELIRALGPHAVLGIIDAVADGGPWRTFCKQPAQRTRTIEQRLHRFIGTRAGRKQQYGRLMVEALELDRVPRPLDGVLARV